jgi:glycosyltransferase involved in cell wall biosynthesis
MLGVWAREHARAVAAQNDVVVLSSILAGADLGRRYDFTEGFEEDWRLVRVRYAGGRMPKATFANRLFGLISAVRWLRSEGFRPDVVHAHVFSSGFPALLLGRMSRAPVVVSEHLSSIPLGELSRFDRVIARFTFQHAALVCPASVELGRHIQPLAPRARLRPIPNAVDTDVFHPGPGGSSSGKDSSKALNVGALTRGKGHADLLHALAIARREVPGLTLDIVGDGPERRGLERLTADLLLRDAVTFHGALPKQHVAEFMRRASFLVLPSRWENAPVVASEALACGLPVLASRVGGIPEIVGADAGILVPAGNPSKLAAGLRDMSSALDRFDPATLAQRARERHGLAAVGAAWDQIYREAISLR